MAQPLKLTDQIRQAVVNSDLTRYAISKATGIPQSTLSRFVHGERGLSMESLDDIAALLHLRIAVVDSADRPNPPTKRSK